MAGQAGMDVQWASAFVSGADLSGKQYHFMRLTEAAGNGLDAKCDIATLATDENVIGVQITKPKASGDHVSVAKYGEVKITVSSEISVGDLLTCAAGGLAIQAASGDIVHGRALQAATGSGQLIGMEIIPGGLQTKR